jgi:hypothetical protein
LCSNQLSTVGIFSDFEIYDHVSGIIFEIAHPLVELYHFFSITPMSAISSNGQILSVDGRGAKYNTREDIAPILDGIDPTKIHEVHFGGNTIGVDASLALAEFLQKASNIKVYLSALHTST